VEIDSGAGCVAPSVESAQDGSYTPLARPLFIYVADQAYTDKPQVAAFVDYYVENVNTAAETAQFIPLNDDQVSELESAAGAIGG
jgi:phosphate transport system substrate-binding protein